MHTACVCVCVYMLLRILHSPDPHKLEGKQMDMVLQTNNLKKGFPNWYLFSGDKCGSKKTKNKKTTAFNVPAERLHVCLRPEIIHGCTIICFCVEPVTARLDVGLLFADLHAWQTVWPQAERCICTLLVLCLVWSSLQPWSPVYIQ